MKGSIENTGKKEERDGHGRPGEKRKEGMIIAQYRKIRLKESRHLKKTEAVTYQGIE